MEKARKIAEHSDYKSTDEFTRGKGQRKKKLNKKFHQVQSNIDSSSETESQNSSDKNKSGIYIIIFN